MPGIELKTVNPVVFDDSKTKQYEIWSEGYQCTGESSDACFHSISTGTTFKNAVDNFAAMDKEFNKNYDRNSMTFWGCKLFDNENDARKSFG